jgi:hypothetical protein
MPAQWAGALALPLAALVLLVTTSTGTG